MLNILVVSFKSIHHLILKLLKCQIHFNKPKVIISRIDRKATNINQRPFNKTTKNSPLLNYNNEKTVLTKNHLCHLHKNEQRWAVLNMALCPQFSGYDKSFHRRTSRPNIARLDIAIVTVTILTIAVIIIITTVVTILVIAVITVLIVATVIILLLLLIDIARILLIITITCTPIIITQVVKKCYHFLSMQ